MKSKLHEALGLMLYLGIDAQYGQVSLCNLAKHCITRNVLERKYQVDSDDARFRYSGIYSNPQTAIDKFVVIYNSLRAKEPISV